MSIHYIGEHLLPGQVGQALIWISFISGILATVLFFLRSRKDIPHASLLRAGSRVFYILQFLSVAGAAVVLYYIIFRHYFEYAYVWQYSSRTLSVEYIISCFWAGQEGSFLIWAIWQALIGLFLIRMSRDWEPQVMGIFTLSQVFLTSMLLGITIGPVNLGGSPFGLLRDTYDSIKDTIFTQPNYLSMIPDGNGLNPLLENIWMTIHPPILFIGYALTLVPFSYALSGLLRKEYHAWIRPAMLWTLLALFFLGAGILLGGAWAYVSLTFGGFWAWDPVENSSLVPWMMLMASLHFMLVARKQHFALIAALIFSSLSYILVLYATYLTRSGVLADTSAHSFGDSGLALQLVVYILVFLVMMIVMIGLRARQVYEKKQEILLSREFWMFIGAFIIVLSAFQVIFTTSIPVVNKLIGTNFAPPTDSVGFYNRWQTPFSLLIAGFIAFSQFLNYNQNNTRTFLRKLWIPLGISAALTAVFGITGVITSLSFILFLFFILFALVASMDNLIFRTSQPRNYGAIITHAGFALFLLGVLITFSNSTTISTNTSGFDLGSEKSNRENLLLVRGDTLYMKGFYVTYVDKVSKGNLTTFQVDFLKSRDGKYVHEFTLHPSVNAHPRMGQVYNPDTRHFPGKDYYTYISAVGLSPDYIVIKTIMNPYINVLWLGALVMMTGIGWSLVRRIRLPRA